MLTVADLLARLDEAEYLVLANATDAGLMNAQLAAECLTAPEHQSLDVGQLLAYLTQAIEQLETARTLVRQRA